MAKTEGKEIQKGSFRCNNCREEFTGADKCPKCGSTQNAKLADDGIDQDLHTVANMFRVLKSTENADVDLLQVKAAAAQMREFDDNMREAYVSRSDIKKKEAEIAKLKKEAELAEMRAAIESGKPIPSSAAASQQNPGGMYDNGMGGMGQFPMFGAMSPQTVLMSKLMKMNGEERKSFLTELGDLDPQAVANLSAMLTQSSPMSMPGGPGGGMYGMPPWMQQQMWMQQMMMNGGHPQQQQQPQPQADPTEIALGLMSSMFEIMQKMQPQKNDDGLKEYFKDLKEELKAMRQKEGGQAQVSELKPILDEIMNLRQQVAAVNQKKGLADTVNEIKGLIDGLESVGLVKKPGVEGRSVDEELKVKQFDFEKETKQKELEIQEKKIEVEKNRADMGKALLTGMLQRSMVKRREGDEALAPAAKKVSMTSKSVERVIRPATPPEIIESHAADAGIVTETRAPVKREV
ncbi:MAG: hypothetical protein PHH85_02085 [Candidatus Methanoperedens sp.]|nr:hypothetical protein [Candidatus Methanoperedens sp.]